MDRGGEIVDLGTLQGDAEFCLATDVNDAGTVVGRSTLGQSIRAFMWRDGVMQDLGEMNTNNVLRVNEAGVVAGTRYVNGADAATSWVDGIASGLPPLPGGTASRGQDIDAAGRIVGDSNGTPGEYHATRWTDGIPFDLGTLPGDTNPPGQRGSHATATNDAGDVVGYASYGSGSRAFLYRDGAMRDLGTLAGAHVAASDVNRHGQVVGAATIDTAQHTHAFVWDEANGLRDLNSLIDPASGWVLERAVALNDGGVIVGTGSLGTFVASPDQDDDGVPDEIDPCTNVGATSPDRLDLALRKKKLRLRADLVVATDPPIDPITHGFRLVLTDSADGAFVDATIPGGTGWRDDGVRASWQAPARQSVGGLTRIRLRRLRNAGALHIDVIGNGVAPVSALPIKVAIVIDAPVARTGQCAEAILDAARCSLGPDGAPVRCRLRAPR
jgi:probable HAF family extracellular repeat protein